MDGAQSQVRPRQYPRAPSRSSTHTSASRMTSVSANSSSSQIATSPQLSQSHSTHRNIYSQGSTGSPRPMSRPTPPLSRQESIESTRQPAMSSFLHEKLQRERKAEIEKFSQSQSSLPKSNSDMNGSIELGRAPGSPFKTYTSDVNRPSSSAGLEHGKKKGHGVKEMEQVISTLHKQNFDLKLELYHRRERQSTLEDRVDALESDKVQMEQVNDKLLIELEKRDKAVEEAVAMIINLETKVDQLFRERTMVQQIENEPFFCSRDYNMGYKTPVPQGLRSDIGLMDDDDKVVNRMPSFLSEHSETTENLRNVYLGSRASVLSLPRVAESSPEGDHMRDMGTPTLSVLSESSFVSVYGRKEKSSDMGQMYTDVDETLVLDQADSTFTKSGSDNPVPRGKARSVSSSKTSESRTSSAGQFQSITDVIGGSPLQRIERLDASYLGRREPGQHQSQGKDPAKASTASPMPPAGPVALNQDKRDTLRKVLTDGPGGVRLHDHALPPTPDTISSSTIQRLQNSNDMLSHGVDVNEESNDGVSLNPTDQGANIQSNQLATVSRGGRAEMDSWASPSRSAIDSLFEHRGPLISRPRSADESTVSHRREKGWESDNDDDSDAHSLESSLDIWMRESAQPSRNKARGSPDLFSFPSTGPKGSWAPDVMYGPGSAGKNQPPPGFDYIQDLFSLRQGIFANTAPPPPNRRSSLHARTGSSEATSQTPGYQNSEHSSSSGKPRSYDSRKNSADVGRRDDLRTPVQRDQFVPPPQPGSDLKQKNYPPIAGQQNGARAGLNRLFRRSGGGAPASVVSEIHAEAISPGAVKNYPAMGTPSWASRSSAVEDDRSGATPPPILIKPRQTRRNTTGAEDEPERPSTQDLPRSKTPGPGTATAAAAAVAAEKEAACVGNSPAAPSVTGTRRKWLPGFSRTNSTRNKTG